MSYTNTVLDKAQAALDAGNKVEARNIIKPVVEAEPNNARAWYLLANATEDDEQRFYYKTRGDQAQAAASNSPPVPPPITPVAPPVATMSPVAPAPVAPVIDRRAQMQLASEIADYERRITAVRSKIREDERNLSKVPFGLVFGGLFVFGGIASITVLGQYGLANMGFGASGLGVLYVAFIDMRSRSLKRSVADAEQELKQLRKELSILQR